MAFRFRLETLLRYRRNVEEREWLKTQILAQQLTSLRGELDSLRQCTQEERSLFAETMRRGLSASEVHFVYECQNSREHYKTALEERVLEVTAKYEEQKTAFLDARKDREVIESLRKQQYTAYVRDEGRREQSQADQMFLLRREVQRKTLPKVVGSICRVPGDVHVENVSQE